MSFDNIYVDIYVADMQRTTIYLDKALKRRLKQMAKARRMTEAQIIREALARHLAMERSGMPRVVGRSEDGGVARRLDDALEEADFGRVTG